MSKYTTDYGQGSSWYNRNWTAPAKPLTNDSCSGWSKRGTRGYPSEYDGWSHHWEESKPSDSTKNSERTTETGNGAEEEIVESRDRNPGVCRHGKCSGNRAGIQGDTAVAIATEKDTVQSRLGEHYRLLNSRNGSLSATYQKNADANTRADDLNQKVMQAWRRSAKPSMSP